MEKRVWFVTGSNRGLGRAFAAEAARRGDFVAAAARRIDGGDPFYANERVMPVRLDVTDAEQVTAAVSEAVERFGRIDVLVNNAGFGMNGALEEITEEELRFLFETNYFGVIRMIKAVLPFMRAQGSGTILNLSSMMGLVGAAGTTAYNAVKFAVCGMSEGLRPELEPFGIRVAAVCPAAFRTDFRDHSSIRFAEHLMPEYDGTKAHDVLDFIDRENHLQEGDPARAAQFIYDLVEREELPRYIMIGKACCDLARGKMAWLEEEIASYYAASCDTTFREG